MGADMLSLNKWRGDNNVLYSRWLSEIVSVPGNVLTPQHAEGESSVLCSLEERCPVFASQIVLYLQFQAIYFAFFCPRCLKNAFTSPHIQCNQPGVPAV